MQQPRLKDHEKVNTSNTKCDSIYSLCG